MRPMTISLTYRTCYAFQKWSPSTSLTMWASHGETLTSPHFIGELNAQAVLNTLR